MTDNPYSDPQQPHGQPQQPQWQPGPPQQGQPQQGQPYRGGQQPWPQQPQPPSYGQPSYGQGQQPQQGNQGYAPQLQFQQQYGNPQYAQQPYGAPPVTGSAPLPKVLGWLMALFAVIAIACCFGPWASAKVSSSVVPISVKMSVNAFNHQSCSGSSEACDEAQKDDSGSSTSSSSMTSPTSDDEDGSIWEGWLIAVIGAAVIVLGVLRGLGKRALSVPAAAVAAAGGLAVIGMTVYRWSWIHDKAGEAKDALGDSGGMAGTIDFQFGSGWGLWLTLVAGVLLLATGIGGLVKRQ